MTAAKRRAAATNSSSHNEQHQHHQHHQQQQADQSAYEHEYQQLLQQPQSPHATQQYHQRQQQHAPALQQQQQQQQQQTSASSSLRDCSVKLPLDILWLPKSAMRPVGADSSHTDCILVVGVSRPKLAVVFLTVMLISLFLTFHVLYDSAVYNIQAAQAVHERHRLSLAASTAAAAAAAHPNANHLPAFAKPASVGVNQPQLSHPMVFPSSRVHFSKTSRRLPQALIIGVRKCGTRALLEMLYLHPRIQKAGGEVHFFDRDENYLKGLDWYRKKMPHSFRGQITIEKSPSYFVSPEVPERVRAMNASIKLLLIVREPVTRAISDYTQLRSHAATAILPLADSSPPTPPAAAAGSGYGPSTAARTKLQSARGYDNALGSGAGGKETSQRTQRARRTVIGTTTTTAATPTTTLSAAQLAGKSFEELAIFPNGTVNEAYRPLSISMYHIHLHRWLEVFPREQLLVVNGDRLIEDPVSQLRRIEAFLGIEHRVKSEHFYFNETKGFYCLRYDNGDRCLRETKGRKHPHVDPVVVSKLRKFFAEYNQRFYELVGEDLGWPEE
ncbi:Hs3st-A [Drosophila busckii]|uniref:Hs3st-A n=1 Tax=Drosophila busckii TaxID=30019 RepID=A0A0M4EHK3_DROBS|nr:heparan sulfate glucosamine 3-O-sulfotransferase 6 [Drosophila busckii]ALC42072.1 Hs3st-A [Drosophila busckii]